MLNCAYRGVTVFEKMVPSGGFLDEKARGSSREVILSLIFAEVRIVASTDV
jgi:hypothetical protein